MRSFIVSCIVAIGLALPAHADEAEFYDFSFRSIEGDALPLERYRGDVVLLVNTASFCGFTNQYAGLQALYEQFREDGLVVLGVPSNSFDQEPGSLADVKFFCETNFGITFPLTEKVAVVGADRHPVYDWAYQKLGSNAAPRWNFHKYLIGRDGTILRWFPSNTPPQSDRLTNAIRQALSDPAPESAVKTEE